MLARVRTAPRLFGEIRVPGDKSISHRALMLNAIADGVARVSNLSPGADVASTATCLAQLGVTIEAGLVRGVGRSGLREPSGPLDCGNSGTTMRLLAGILAGQRFSSTLTGDNSLSRRPMGRVAEPLRLMGAQVSTEPLRVGGWAPLRAIDYRTPVASAQVKSALLLAGLYAEGETTIREPGLSRDHTELMMRAMGANLQSSGLEVRLRPSGELAALDVEVPGDLSSAAFWLVLGSLHGNAELSIPSVGINPTRAGILDLMDGAGFEVERRRPRLAGEEPVADLLVSSSRAAHRFDVTAAESAALIDELPVLAVAASVLSGTTTVTGASELAVKESDRITAMTTGLRAMGADIEPAADGWVIRGPRRLEGARVDSFGDHRVAMSLAIAAMLAGGETEIDGAECVEISYPGFWDQLESLCR